MHSVNAKQSIRTLRLSNSSFISIFIQQTRIYPALRRPLIFSWIRGTLQSEVTKYHRYRAEETPSI